jgi:hypothetical protein
VCDASFAEIETYGRQVMEQIALRQRLGDATPGQPTSPPPVSEVSSKAYDVVEIRRQHAQAYAAWSDEDDARLRGRFRQGATVEQLVKEFGRKPGGIRSRLRKLGLTGPNNAVVHLGGNDLPETALSSEPDSAS